MKWTKGNGINGLCVGIVGLCRSLLDNFIIVAYIRLIKWVVFD